MARVRSLCLGNRRVRVHSKETDCEYQILLDESGEKILSLSTFGSDERQDIGAVSQSLQLDEASAIALARVIRETFRDEGQ